MEPPFLLFDIAAILNGLDDWGIGAGPADRLFFESLDQRGFAVARRRLGEVLGGVKGMQVERIAGRQRRQQLIFLLAAWPARPGGGRRTSGSSPGP